MLLCEVVIAYSRAKKFRHSLPRGTPLSLYTAAFEFSALHVIITWLALETAGSNHRKLSRRDSPTGTREIYVHPWFLFHMFLRGYGCERTLNFPAKLCRANEILFCTKPINLFHRARTRCNTSNRPFDFNRPLFRFPYLRRANELVSRRYEQILRNIRDLFLRLIEFHQRNPHSEIAFRWYGSPA